MKRVRQYSGRLAFWCGWPLLWVYLRGSHRTRIVVLHQGKILAVRGWLGDNWGLPGGGLHHGEMVSRGAIRELTEETGIVVNPSLLTPLIASQKMSEHGLPMTISLFELSLASPQALRRQRGELTDIGWFTPAELLSLPRLSSNARDLVAFWREHTSLLH